MRIQLSCGTIYEGTPPVYKFKEYANGLGEYVKVEKGVPYVKISSPKKQSKSKRK